MRFFSRPRTRKPVAAPSARRSRWSFRPNLDRLEDRWVPAYLVTNLGDNVNDPHSLRGAIALALNDRGNPVQFDIPGGGTSYTTMFVERSCWSARCKSR